MMLLDANVLLYAYNKDAPQHSTAAAWVEESFGRQETIGLPWTTIWAFLRLSTNARVWPNPMPVAQAFRIIHEWLAQLDATIVNPGPRHGEILERLVTTYRVTGPLMSDAALAALALEHGAALVSTDHDFRRFPELRWINPLA